MKDAIHDALSGRVLKALNLTKKECAGVMRDILEHDVVVVFDCDDGYPAGLTVGSIDHDVWRKHSLFLAVDHFVDVLNSDDEAIADARMALLAKSFRAAADHLDAVRAMSKSGGGKPRLNEAKS